MKKGFDCIGISVITMCHDGKGKYLMEIRGPECSDEQGAWAPVGGGAVEPHESLQEAVSREIYEECGAQSKNIEYIGFREVFREFDGKKSHWISFDFKVEIDPREVSIKEPEKCLEHRWCNVDEIPQPMHSQFPPFLEKYKDIL